jgi:hypothetical protein
MIEMLKKIAPNRFLFKYIHEISIKFSSGLRPEENFPEFKWPTGGMADMPGFPMKCSMSENSIVRSRMN